MTRKKYADLHRKTAYACRSILMKDDCSVEKEFQTAYVLPLYYDMLGGTGKESDRAKTAAHLDDLVKRDGYHIGTGFPGTPYILFALADSGYENDAFRMLLTDTCPSWLYEVKTGGTTIWERWDALREDGTCNTGEGDGTGGMVSFNHYASGAVGDFLYRRIAGIEADEGGYKTFHVKPLIKAAAAAGITSCEGYVTCAYGEIRVSWAVRDGRAQMDVTVPVGTECEVFLPDGSGQKVSSGKYSFSCRLLSE